MTSELQQQQKLINLLLKDQKLFNEFLNSSKQSVILVNKNGIIKEWNQPTELITGLQKSETIGTAFADILKRFIPKLDTAESFKNKIDDLLLSHAFNTKEHFNKFADIRIVSVNNEIKCLKVLLTRYAFDGNTYLAIISEDYTKERLFHKKAKNCERYLNKIFENRAIGIAIKSLSGDYIKVNRKFCNLLNYSSEELVQMNEKDITHPDDRLKELDILERTIKNKEDKYTIEKRLVSKDNRTIWTRLNVIFQYNKDHSVESIIEFIEDISKIRLAEAHLNESERKYRFLVENASDIIYSISLDSKITFYNRTIEKIFEKPIEELSKMNYDQMMLPKDKIAAKKMHEDRLGGKKPPIFKHGFKTPSGKIVYLELSVNPLFDENNEVIGSLGIARDITDKEMAEQELHKKNIELENAIKTKDQFLSIIAHDLRDPFNTLLGYSELILNSIDSISTEKLKRYTEAINSSANNTFTLLQNLLDWSKCETGSIKYNPSNINLSQIINYISHNLNYSASKKNIEIIHDFSDSIVAYADENMVRTVIRNLISNAIKFSFESGKIIIKVDDNSDKIIFHVKDHGVGLSNEEKQSIFEKNNAFTKMGTLNEKGNGLGLNICQEFIKKWNGEFLIESNPGMGSTFSFTIPK